MPGDYIKIGVGFGLCYVTIIMSNQVQTSCIEDDSIKQSYEGGGSAYLMNMCLIFVSEKM